MTINLGRANKSDKKTITRGAFKLKNELDPEISVYVRRMLNSPLEALEGRVDWGLGEIIAKDAKSLGFEVYLDPLPGKPAHAVIKAPEGFDNVLADKLVGKVRSLKFPGVDSHLLDDNPQESPC